MLLIGFDIIVFLCNAGLVLIFLFTMETVSNTIEKYLVKKERANKGQAQVWMKIVQVNKCFVINKLRN